MNPMTQFCHNLACPARGQVGQGTITIHSQKEQRYRCKSCGKTFAATTGTPFYRLKVAVDLITIVVILLTHGCPVQAIVAAFGVDERSVANWLRRAGQHAQHLHQHLVQQHQIDLQHVQADELWVKLVGRKVWQAMAMAVPSRLWLGGVISARRDRHLITALVTQVRASALTLALLVCGRSGQLRHSLSEGVSAPHPDREAWTTASGARERLADRPGGQALRQGLRDECDAARGTRQPACNYRDTGGDREWNGHQHSVYRAVECDLSLVAGLLGPPRARNRPHGGLAHCGDVVGGCQL